MADASRRSTRFSARSKLLGQLLLENGDVRAEQMAHALKIQEQQGGLVGQILQNLEACSAMAIGTALLKQVQVTDVRCEELQVPPDVSELVPRELCDAERLCPFERLGALLCLVMGNPLNRKAILQIEERARLKVKSFKAPWPKIQELIQYTYGESGLAMPEARRDGGTHGGTERGAGEMPGAGTLDIQPSLAETPPVDEAPVAEEPPGEEAPAVEALPAAEPPVAEAPAGEGALELEALPGEGMMPAEAPPDEAGAVAGEPQPAAETQAEDSQQPESCEEAAAGGILPVTESLLAGSDARRVHEPAPPPAPMIEGLEDLDESHAEMIETTARGLSRRGMKAKTPADETAQPQAEQKAKINVDLDKLDFSGAGAVAVGGRGEEAAEEAAPPMRASMLGMAQLKTVPDSYFFADDAASPEARSEELLDFLSGLPIAETVAPSIGAYETQSAAPAALATPALKPAAPAAKPVELESAPAAPVAALPISDADFNQAAVALVEDPVGEWDWQYAAAGPLEVEAYEEN